MSLSGVGNPVVVEDHHMLMEFAEYSDGRLVCFEVHMEVCWGIVYVVWFAM